MSIIKLGSTNFSSNIVVSRGLTDKEEDNITLFAYDVQIGDKNSFAILSDDLRIGDVICVVDKGSSADISDNPFMGFFAVALDNYITETASIWEDLNDTDIEQLKEKYGITDEDIERAKAENEVNVQSRNPMFGTTYSGWEKSQQSDECILKTNWGQGYPYNDAIQVVYNKDYASGCGAIATAQIMAYHKYPKKCESWVLTKLKEEKKWIQDWDGIFEWDKMTENPSINNFTDKIQAEVGALIYQIAESCNAKYGLSETGTSTESYTKCFKKNGYSCNDPIKYSFSKIKNSLDEKNPVLARGDATKKVKKWWFITISTTYDDGHAWVIDGYKRNSRTKTVYVFWIPFKSTEYDNFVHCNYGWYGNSDGYYRSEVFNTDSGYTFQYNLKIIPDIHPNTN